MVYVSCQQKVPDHTTPDRIPLGSLTHTDLSAEQLYEIGHEIHNSRYSTGYNSDSALMFFNMVLTLKPQNLDSQVYKKLLASVRRWSSGIYLNKGDFRSAYEMLLHALQYCEPSDSAQILNIYMNLGNILTRISKYDLAKTYYLKALDVIQPKSRDASDLLGNLAYLEIKMGNLDEASNILNQSLHGVHPHEAHHRILYSFAEFYRKKEIYDSAYLYFGLALNRAMESEFRSATTARISQDKGEFFFERNQLDSAIAYLDLSNAIASKHGFLRTLSANYLTLSKIAESKGQNLEAFNYHRQHFDIRDQIFDLEVIDQIDQIQRSQEISETNRQMEQLAFEQRLVKQQMRYQSLFLHIMIGVFLLTTTGLLLLFIQNKKLNFANQKLVDKNLTIVELQEHPFEIPSKKHPKSALPDEMQKKLLERIYAVMEDVSVVCDPELTVEKLADLVQSNRAYVSSVINEVSKKNFRAFLNEYRIREAQRLILEAGISSKYTLEAIARQVGFKSRNTFHLAFVEITGVNPKTYLKIVTPSK